MPTNARRKTARVYYGTDKVKLFWTVVVSDAKKNVTIDGSLLDAITGKKGQTIGCHMSNCAMRNQAAFPHPVVLAAFTKRSALIVDKIVKGQPAHAIRYHHKYSWLVNLNDTDSEKSIIKMHPELVERQFTLQTPWKNPTRAGRGITKGKISGVKMAKVPRGALARAKRAGLITAELEA